MRFKDYIPPDLFDYPEVEKLVQVLDRLHVSKRQEIDRVFYLYAESSLSQQRVLLSVVSELYGLSFPEAIHISILQRLEKIAGRALKEKGTITFLKTLMEAVSCGKVVLMPRRFYESASQSYIILDDRNNEFLPSFEDVQGLINGTKDDFLYLYDGLLDEGAYFESIIVSPFANNAEFRNFAAEMFERFLHNRYSGAGNLRLYFYGYGMLTAPFLPSWYYDIKNTPLAAEEQEQPSVSGTDFDLNDFSGSDFY